MATGEDVSEYQLSCEILGHSADVRAVQTLPADLSSTSEDILTASRDGTACVWAPEIGSNREYVLQKVFRQHVGYVSALCAVPRGITVAGHCGREFLQIMHTQCVCAACTGLPRACIKGLMNITICEPMNGLL